MNLDIAELLLPADLERLANIKNPLTQAAYLLRETAL
jgi:hypothetical protein